MGGQVTVDTSEIERLLGSLRKEAKNLPMDVFGEIVISNMDDLIESGGRGQWPNFADSTLKRHPRRAGGQLLLDTGQLVSFQARETEDSVTISSPAPYAGWHAEGTSKMPQRDFMDVEEESADEIVDLLIQELIQSVK